MKYYVVHFVVSNGLVFPWTLSTSKMQSNIEVLLEFPFHVQKVPSSNLPPRAMKLEVFLHPAGKF
jgi:hypothetical protein